MAKRFIGIDLEGTDVRVAVLTAGTGQPDIALDMRQYDSAEEAAGAIREMLGGKVILGDRLMTALPCRVGLFRRLGFPFRERSKIEEALTLELSSQLPVSLEEHLISFMPPRARENDYEVDAVVVNRGEIEELLKHFPEPEHNPRRIGLFPFALLPILKDRDGILVYCRRQEVVVALIHEERVVDYRLLPGTGDLDEDEVFEFISHQIGQLENAVGIDDLPLWVIGAGVTEKLLVSLYNTDRQLVSPAEEVFGDDLSYEMAPAALLALVEMRSGRNDEQLNFRKGEFAARGQLEIFRTKVIVAVFMLFVVLCGAALAMHLGYLQKSRQEQELKQQMNNIYRQVARPGAPVVDISMQMKAQLGELRQQVQMFGLGGQGAAITLQTLSRAIDKELRIDVDEFSYSAEEVRVRGTADSFEAVNAIAETLGEEGLFQSVEIADAKLATDSSQVAFELQLTLSGGGGE